MSTVEQNLHLCTVEARWQEKVRVIAPGQLSSESNEGDSGGHNLSRKVKEYEDLLRRLIPRVGDEDRVAIENCLLTVLRFFLLCSLPTNMFEAPQPTEVSTQPRLPKPDGIRDGDADGDANGDADGESDISGVGSMGSTGHAHEEQFKGAKSGRKLQAFVGQSSEEKWIQRLEEELPDPPSDEWRFLRSHNTASANDGSSSPQSDHYGEDVDAAIGDEIDPYGLPIRMIADRLVELFFATIYPSFPIINKAYFFNRYDECFPTAQMNECGDQTFLVMLQLILAIGAVHAHIIRAEWAGDERDHLLYFARARALGLETGLLEESVYHEQVQIFGLGGMYLMVTNQTNR